MKPKVLDTIDPVELGKLLQGARKRAGRTQEDAANAIEAARTTIVAIEKGERRIRETELFKLAELFGRSVGEFVRRRPSIGNPAFQFRGPFLRTELEQSEIEPSLQEFEDLCTDYLELETLTASTLVRRYPFEYASGNLSADAEADHVAAEERHRLRLGDGPITNLRSLLEREVGLRIFGLSLPGKFCAIYFFTEEAGGCIALNLNHPVERQAMSLAHDYSHFLASRHRAVVLIEDRYKRLPHGERFAESFGPAFLMPESGLARRIGDIRRERGSIVLADLLELAASYCVSLEALCIRLEDLRLIPSGTIEGLKRRGLKVREAQKELGLTLPTDGGALPQRYIDLAIEAFQTVKISEGRLARFLRVDRMSVRQLGLDDAESDVGAETGGVVLDHSVGVPEGV